MFRFSQFYNLETCFQMPEWESLYEGSGSAQARTPCPHPRTPARIPEEPLAVSDDTGWRRGQALQFVE